MKSVGAYTITEQKTGKFYVGSSQDMEKRVERHFNELKKKIHHNVLLQKLYDQDRVFVISFFPTENRDEAYLIEQDMIDRYTDSPLLLNIGRGVKGGDNLTNHPDRDRILEKIVSGAAKFLGALTPLERKQLWGKPGELNPMYGRTHSVATRKILSEKNKGKPGPLGFRWTDESKKKISDYAKTRTGDKNPFFGKHHSEETKRKLSERMLGSKPNNSRKVKVGDTVYDCLTDVSRALKVSPALIVYRLKKPDKYPEYSYVV